MHCKRTSINVYSTLAESKGRRRDVNYIILVFHRGQFRKMRGAWRALCARLLHVGLRLWLIILRIVWLSKSRGKGLLSYNQEVVK